MVVKDQELPPLDLLPFLLEGYNKAISLGKCDDVTIHHLLKCFCAVLVEHRKLLQRFPLTLLTSIHPRSCMSWEEHG